MGGKDINFINNPKIRKFWVERIYQFTIDSWENGYKDYFPLDRFFLTQYENIVEDWDEAEGMGSDDEDLITDFTRDYPMIEDMVNGWGYDIEYSIIEYMDIMRQLIEESKIRESKSTIKNILREQSPKRDKLFNIVLNDLHKEFAIGGVTKRIKQLKLKHYYSDLMRWMSDVGDKHIKNKFGLSGKNDYEMLVKLRNTFYATTLNLPKIGSRIRLIKMDDEWANLKEGDEGTVLGYNPTPWGDTLMMHWDMGSGLDIDPNEDEYEVLS